MNVDYPAVLVANYSGTQWTMDGDEYDGLNWLDTSPKPSKAELDAAWPQVQYQNQVAAVERARLTAYEQKSDPVFFKWQRGDATEQEWRDAVQAVKDANPYPPAP